MTDESGLRSIHIEVLRTARVALLGGMDPAGSGAGTDPAGSGRRVRGPAEVWYALHGYRQLARRFLPRFAPIAGPDRLVVAPEGLSRFYLDPVERSHDSSDTVGASWMTRDDREVEIVDYIRYLDRTVREIESRSGSGPKGRTEWRGGPESRSGPEPQGAPMLEGSLKPQGGPRPQGGTESQGGPRPQGDPESHGGPTPHRTVVGFSQGAHTASRWAVLGSVRPDRLVLWGTGLPGDLPEGSADRLRTVGLTLVRGETDSLRNLEAEEHEEAWLAEEGVPFRVLTHPGGHRIDAGVLKEIAGAG